MMYFARMLDKIRLHARDELHHDYLENLGRVKAADGACCNYLRMHYRDLRERVLQGGDVLSLHRRLLRLFAVIA